MQQTMERSDYLAKDMVLFKAVDNVGFKTLMHTLGARYDPLAS